MKKSLIVTCICILTATGFTACRHDPEIPALPEVSFSNDVLLILNANCNFSGCHTNGGGGEAGSLETYDDVFRQVEAYNANASNLFRVVSNHSLQIMPPAPRSPLTNEQVKTIYLWIEQGAKNN